MFRIRAVISFVSLATLLGACGSSSDDSSNNGSGGSGGSGGKSSPMNECSLTKCYNPTAISDSNCAQMKASSCWTLAKSWIDCHKANDECLPDGTQDTSKVGIDCINRASDVASCLADGGVQ